MKNAKVENRKIVKAAQPRRVAGVPVRSGIKAGRRFGPESEIGRGGRGIDVPGKIG
jgi:hypothetical protein